MKLLVDLGQGARAALLVVGVVCAAGGVRAESLSDTLVTAYKNSPDLAAARANLKIQSERAVQARAQGRLQLSGDASITARYQELSRQQEFVQGVGRYDLMFPNSVSLTAIQPLYTGGQVENSVKAAETRISEQGAVVTATEQTVLLNAVTAFMNVRRDDQLVSVSKNNVRVLNEQLRAAQERFQVGEVTRTDVEQARARLSAARSGLAAARGALDASREQYRQVVGTAPGNLASPPPLPDLPATQNDAVAIALQENPNISAAQLERKATGSDVRAAMGALLPQLSLQGTVQSANADMSSGARQLQDAAVGIFLTVPIWSGGANYSRVREAQASAEQASSQITSQMRAAVQRVGVAWADLQVARASIKAGMLEVKAAQLAFQGVTEEAKVGARTTIDVLNAEQDVLNAKASLIQAQRNEYVASYTLLAAIGKLTVKHLGLDVGPTAGTSDYYKSVRNRNFGYDKTDDTVWKFTLHP